MLSPTTRGRIAATLATLVALAAGALAGQQMLPASATTSTAPAPVLRATGNLIQGVVVDDSGRPVDGVQVGAYDAAGERVASAETYASNWPGGRQHGYFFVEVPRGSFTIKLTKPGYRPVVHEAGRITDRITKISMGEIEIQKVVAVATTTTASLVEARITTKDKGKVTVTVRPAKGGGKVTGKVEVRTGKNVLGEATLGKSTKGGTVTITLDKLRSGKHTLTAYFLGSAEHRASSSKRLTVTVTKPRR